MLRKLIIRAGIVGWCALSVYVWVLVLAPDEAPVPAPRVDPPSEESVLAAIEASCADASSMDEAKPAIRLPPHYPEAALQNRIEGMTELGFTVLPDGRTSEISIGESLPPGVFDEVSLEAIRGWRYCPRSEPDLVKVRLRFALPDEPSHRHPCEELRPGVMRKICDAVVQRIAPS